MVSKCNMTSDQACLVHLSETRVRSRGLMSWVGEKIMKGSWVTVASVGWLPENFMA